MGLEERAVAKLRLARLEGLVGSMKIFLRMESPGMAYKQRNHLI